ncbi:MAG: HTTM domain-containing protein [Candidatus Peregrinibacteria bacterium]|nr:HTTM domain-containing protein [Candidatus Peregrinibacteria bacterium]
MGIVRIVVGGWLLFFWGIRLPHVTLLYSTAGPVLPSVPAYMPARLTWIFTTVPEPSVALLIFAVHLLLLLCVLLGIATRLSAGLAFLSSWYYFYLSHYLFHSSFDRLYIMALLFLALSGAGETLSISAWRRYGSPFKWENMISVFPQRLFALQLMMTYLGVGFQKLWLPDWQTGEMLWYAMIGVWGTPLAFKITALGWTPLYHVLVNLVKIMECFWPFGFWIRRAHVRFIAFGSAALFHILVDQLLYIWWFAVLIPSYITFFEPEEVERWLASCSKSHRFRSAPKA